MGGVGMGKGLILNIVEVRKFLEEEDIWIKIWKWWGNEFYGYVGGEGIRGRKFLSLELDCLKNIEEVIVVRV